MCDLTQDSLLALTRSLPFEKNGYIFKDVLESNESHTIFLVNSKNYKNVKFGVKATPKLKVKNYVYSLSQKYEQIQNHNIQDNSNVLTKDFEILKLLNSPTILSAYDFFEDKDNYYIVGEFCELGSLRKLLKNKEIKSFKKKIYLMKKITECVAFCHSNYIAHRDIRPDNFLIDKYFRPKLCNFGMAERFKAESISDHNNINYRNDISNCIIDNFSGNIAYISPEIILNTPYNPFKSDIWALGVTFFEILNGCLPWGKCPKSVMEDLICQGEFIMPRNVPDDIAKLINQCLSVNPNERPTAQQILSNPIFDHVKSQNTESYSNISISHLAAHINLISPTIPKSSTLKLKALSSFRSSFKSKPHVPISKSIKSSKPVCRSLISSKPLIPIILKE